MLLLECSREELTALKWGSIEDCTQNLFNYLTMKYNELYRLLEKAGWRRKRTKKHHIYIHKDCKGAVVVGKHGSEEEPKGTLNSILKQAGLK